MLRGLARLTWLEIKIFVREPLGVVGSIFIPVAVFVVLGRIFGRAAPSSPTDAGGGFVTTDVPIMVSLFIAINTVLSLVTIISIYREGGILKRLRATPLRPHTILTAHVLAKLLMTGITIGLMILAGRRYYPVNVNVPVGSFALAMLITSLAILSIGFVIASVVPTARFAQPVGALVLYPMIALSGLFVPVASYTPGLQLVARALPLTYAVSLLRGIWNGEAWSAHTGDVLGLAVVFVIGTAISARVFRWE
ncbi:MAG: ABC transporter permease [Gemmatimonadaceae bacterium]